jgi:hypothetical protein
MFYLATEVAQHRALELTTDSSDYWAVGTVIDRHKGATDDRRNGASLKK